jgi:hypothetical protein
LRAASVFSCILAGLRCSPLREDGLFEHNVSSLWQAGIQDGSRDTVWAVRQAGIAALASALLVGTMLAGCSGAKTPTSASAGKALTWDQSDWDHSTWN